MLKTDTPLPRGKACLCCKKRKMKCDGARPVCSQCIKANREVECHYVEKKQISRTQLLQQKVAKLEARLRELEAEQSESAVSSPTPSIDSASTSSTNDTASTHPDWDSGLFDDGVFASLASSDFSAFLPSHMPNSNFETSFSDSYGESSSSLVDLQASSSSQTSSWWEDKHTFCLNKQALLNIFLAHRHQCAFDVHIGRLLQSVRAPPKEQPHPALMDAIYLMGCYFSRAPDLTIREPHFLKRALCGISDSLSDNDRVVDVLRASSLLAIYFFGKGRILEGYYHSSISARLAVSLGLHQIKSNDVQQMQFSSLSDLGGPLVTSKSPVQLSPPKDSIESQERIAAFWQVFCVDRAWSVATGLPAALPDDDHPQAQIETVWPAPFTDYMASVYDGSNAVYDPVASYPNLRAKAVALFERSFRLSSSASASGRGDAFWMEYRYLDNSLIQFARFLPPIGSACGQPITLASMDLLNIHTLIHVSSININRELAEQEYPYFEKSLQAAALITTLISELTDEHYFYLDPITSTCWSYIADVFVRSLASPLLLQSGLFDAVAVNQLLGTIVIAMKKISVVFPIAGIHASKVIRESVFPPRGSAIIIS